MPDGMTEFCIVCCTYVMQLYRFGYFINFFDARGCITFAMLRFPTIFLHDQNRNEYNSRSHSKYSLQIDYHKMAVLCSGFLINPFHLQVGSECQLLPPPFPCKCKCNWSLLSSLANVPVLMISDTRYLHTICGLPTSLFWSILSPSKYKH